MRYLILFGMVCSAAIATLAPWPVQPEYYGILGHWRFNDHQVAGAVAQYKLDDEAANTVVDNNLGTDATWGHGNTDQHDAASWCTAFGCRHEVMFNDPAFNAGWDRTRYGNPVI